MKRLLKYLSVIVLTIVTVSLIHSCKKEDPAQPEQPSTIEITDFDDLRYFQDCIIRVDSLGNFQYRALGAPLDAADTARLFIGVESLDEAEQFFRYWIAPDVTISEENGNLTCPLTDKDGNAQGTVYFRPASGSGSIAEVTASDNTSLLYFRQITFMHNDDWPVVAPESIWHKFDIVHNLNLPASINDHLQDEDKSLNWVCVRESGNGVPPVFCTVTNGIYCNLDKYCDEDIDFYRIRTTWFCPGMSGAQNIGNMLQPDWDLFRAVFQEATGNDNLGNALWVNEVHCPFPYLRVFYSLFFYSSNYTYGETQTAAQFLLRIEWVNDEDIYDGATIPDHQ